MKFIIGNWKMYLSPKDGEKLANQLILRFGKKKIKDLILALCPSFDSIQMVGSIIKNSNFKLGAQDIFWEEKGAFIGEESVKNLKELGCEYVIVGHSERRKLGETNEVVAKKFSTIVAAGLTPILCIGETKIELDAGKKNEVIKRQLLVPFSKLQATRLARAPASLAESRRAKRASYSPRSRSGEAGKLQDIVIAYEPVWAIGTGIPEIPENAKDTHKFIKKFIKDNFPKISKFIHVIYGGSVNGENIGNFLNYPEIEGALIGGASTKAEEFLKIIKQVASMVTSY